MAPQCLSAENWSEMLTKVIKSPVIIQQAHSDEAGVRSSQKVKSGNQVRAREIRGQPRIKLQHSLKAIPEQNECREEKCVPRLLGRPLSKSSRLDTRHHYLCACWVQAAKPQGKADALSALTSVTQWWSKSYVFILRKVEKGRQTLDVYCLRFWKWYGLASEWKICPKHQTFILISFWNLIQHDMVVPINHPVPALLTLSSNSNNKSSFSIDVSTSLGQEYISLSTVLPRLQQFVQWYMDLWRG